MSVLQQHVRITAFITYGMPDYPSLVQEFIWQADDWPDCRNLRKFLRFWRRELEGPLKCVRVAQSQHVSDAQFRNVQYLH